MTQFKEKELSLKNLFRIFVFKQEYGRIILKDNSINLNSELEYVN